MHRDASDLSELYKDVHRHPELSMRGAAHGGAGGASACDAAGFEVTTGVGGTGVVGLLRNGDGPTVMLRADMDALPVAEQTGPRLREHGRRASCTPAATTCTSPGSRERPPSSPRHREGWHGTRDGGLPARRGDGGGRAGDDRRRPLRPVPEAGRDPRPARDAGAGGHRSVRASGVITSAADSFEIRMFGRGAHGSMPEASIDPVVMAAATVLRLQTIVVAGGRAGAVGRRHRRRAAGRARRRT